MSTVSTLTEASDWLDFALGAIPDADDLSMEGWEAWQTAVDALADDMEEHGWALRSGPTAGLPDVQGWEVSRLGVIGTGETLPEAADDWCHRASTRCEFAALMNGVEPHVRPRGLNVVRGS